MNNYRPRALTSMIALSLALLSPLCAEASPKDSPAKASRRTVNLCNVPEVALPQSVFSIPSQPTDGRNPFFPQSSVRVLVPKVNKETPIETFSFILNGITSRPRPTAMINGRTFEPGEEAEVKLPAGGKMMIKCEEIKSESAVIVVGGQRRELKLRSGV